MNALALLTFSAINLGTAGYTLVQPPEGTVSKDTVTTGSTEIGNQGKFAAAGTAEDKKADDATEFEGSAGGFLATGNAAASSATALLKFRLRRGAHQFRSEFAGNFGWATVIDEDGNSLNRQANVVGNVQGMVRYDWFFAKRWSVFLQSTARHDPFQDLDLRLNVDPGFSFYALTDPKQRLWFEAGYDFQYDLRTQDVVDESTILDLTNEIEDVDRVFINHAARLFGGYVNNLNEYVTFDTGLEYLQSVIDPEIFRINWATALTANLNNRISLGTTFTLRYENKPVAPKQLDTITSVLLGVRFI